MSFYGCKVQFMVEVLGCDRDTVQLRTELYQNGQLVGSQECWLGAFMNHERVALSEEIFQSLRADIKANTRPLPEEHFSPYAADLARFPVSATLTTRYADLDADNQRSEAAIVRYMEQARFSTLQDVDLDVLSMLMAAVDIKFFHYQPGSEPINLLSGVSHIGNTSFHLISGAVSDHGIHAIANGIVVIVNPDTHRPVPMTDDIRAQLSLRGFSQ